jgi:alanine racemase
MPHDPNQAPGLLHHRPTCAYVDLGALRRNYRAIKRLVGSAKIMPSIKANGYGHGLVEVAATFQSEGAAGVAVALIEEAIQLRNSDITIPILVFGGILGDQLPLFLEYDIDITASSVSKLQLIDEEARRIGRCARVHLKIDTGLERIGIHYYTSQQLFDAAIRCNNIAVVGVYSHFAAISPSETSLGAEQLERFLHCLSYYDKLSPSPYCRHIAASTGVLGLQASYLDMVRPGLILYGVYPDEEFRAAVTVEPVLSLKSQIVYFKVVKKGAGVSYGHRWHAPEDTRVVTVPIGYGDGYSRALSNRASVLIRGEKRPVIGSVCMDQLMVDLGPDGVGYNGDEVVLIGEQNGSKVSVEELARILNTTPHEILVLLNQRIPRIYSDER